MSAMFALLLDVTTIFVLAAWLLSGAGALMPLPAAPPARSREALRLALLPAVGGGLVVLAALSPSVRTWIDGGRTTAEVVPRTRTSAGCTPPRGPWHGTT